MQVLNCIKNYEINIGYRTRQKLILTLMSSLKTWIKNDSITSNDFLHLFDSCCVEMIILLQGSFKRFKHSYHFKKFQSLNIMQE